MEDVDSRTGYFYFFGVIVLVIAVLFFRAKVCERVIVNGPSMQPNFYEDDVCWAIKSFDEIERYDVVVAKDDNGKQLIKRVVGLPGDQIRLEDGCVYINDEKIDDEYDFLTYPDGTKQYKRWESDMDDGFYFFTDMQGETESDVAFYSCGENEYFLLGDNRQNSADSRILGNFDRESIKGKVVFRFFPFNRINKI